MISHLCLKKAHLILILFLHHQSRDYTVNYKLIIKSSKIPVPGVRGAINVKNADIHAKDYADVYVGDNSEQIQAYDRNGPVKKPEVFSMAEIEMQWICMESRGKSGRPGHPSYDPNPEWSDCNQAFSHQYAPILLLISLLNAHF